MVNTDHNGNLSLNCSRSTDEGIHIVLNIYVQES